MFPLKYVNDTQWKRRFRPLKLRLTNWSTFLLFILLINPVQSADFTKLDKAIPDDVVSILAPVFDFDEDSCLPSAGISRSGQKNPGLKTSGSITGDCRSSNFLDTSNTLHRHACTSVHDSKYCGHFYALYFEKDQISSIFNRGHRHDWEHAAIWTTNGQITHASVSAHGDMDTRTYAELPFDEDGHVKIVYHKDHVVTHALRFAKKDEWAENPSSHFVTPTLTSWYSLTGDGISNSEMRTKLNNFDYGDATIPLKRSNFLANLNTFKPSSYPTFQDQEDCQFTNRFSEENPSGQMCPRGSVVTGIKCFGRYCDNKQLQCCKVPSLKVSGSVQYSPYFSEEGANSYKDDGEVVVGMQCTGRYCDNISLITQSAQGIGGVWTSFFSEESGQGYCNSGSYVAGVQCTGRYCDKLSLYCKVAFTTDDLIWQRDNGQVHYWLMGNGQRLGSHNIAISGGAEWSIEGVGDVDGDGTDDIVWQHTDGQVYYWRMDNSQLNGGDDIAISGGPEWSLEGVGDVDGDGTDDIVWQHTNGQVHYWSMDNGQRKDGHDIAISGGPEWSLEGVGDVDGDGTDDIIWQHTNGQVHYWSMDNGQLNGGDDIAISGGSEWSIEGIGDIDGDGTDDIIWQHTNGQVHYWSMGNGQRLGGFDIHTPVHRKWKLQGVGNMSE